MPKKTPKPPPSPLALFTQKTVAIAKDHPEDFLKNLQQYHTTLDAIAATTAAGWINRALDPPTTKPKPKPTPKAD